MTRRVIQVVVTVALLGLIAWGVDFGRLKEHLGRIELRVWLLVFMMILIQNDIVTTRWGLLLQALAKRLPHHQLLQMQYMGLFAQVFLPSSIGGAAVRAWTAHRAGVGLSAAINSVVFDRLAAFVGLLILTAFALPFTWGLLFPIPTLSILAVTVCTSAIFATALVLVLRRWPLTFWLARLERTFVAPLARLLREAGSRMLRPWFIAKVVGLALLGQSITMLAVFMLAQGTGIQVNPIDCLFLMPPVMLLAALPISISGWGVREGAMIVAFGMVGVEREAALILSIQFALIGSIVGLTGAAFWFRMSSETLVNHIKRLRDEV